MKQKIKVALCLPWYAGADRDCVVHFLEFQHYLGRLQERLKVIAKMAAPYPEPFPDVSVLGKLDPVNQTGFSEIPKELYGTEIEFGLVEEIGCSLPGMARERCIDNALAWGADYLMFYDADMIFGTDVFFKLFMAQKPVVAALAFTGRQPIAPVIYRFKDYKLVDGQAHFDSQAIFDYKQDTLQQVDGVGGGVFMVEANVFKSLAKPWFATSSALGEDIYFCARCKIQDIEVWVHTGAKTLHKPTFPSDWHGEVKYLRENPVLRPTSVPSIDYTPEPNVDLAKEINELGACVVNAKAQIWEGSSTLPQLQFIQEQAKDAKNVCEVGFNAGMSAAAMLLSNPELKVTSFDESRWDCVAPAKAYVDNRFPSRHTLVAGNSIDTLTQLNGERFDFSLIDGGHDFPTAFSDIKNLAPRSKKLMIDDVNMPGVKAALEKSVLEGIVKDVVFFENGTGSEIPRKWAMATGGVA